MTILEGMPTVLDAGEFCRKEYRMPIPYYPITNEKAGEEGHPVLFDRLDIVGSSSVGRVQLIGRVNGKADRRKLIPLLFACVNIKTTLGLNQFREGKGWVR